MAKEKTYRNLDNASAEPNNRVTQELIDKCNAKLKGTGIHALPAMSLQQNINWINNALEVNEKKLAQLETAVPKQRAVLTALHKLWEKRYGKPFVGTGTRS